MPRDPFPRGAAVVVVGAVDRDVYDVGPHVGRSGFVLGPCGDGCGMLRVRLPFAVRDGRPLAPLVEVFWPGEEIRLTSEAPS